MRLDLLAKMLKDRYPDKSTDELAEHLGYIVGYQIGRAIKGKDVDVEHLLEVIEARMEEIEDD
jgi:CRISPR/Cas system CSM-associated protein Csm2 small subunit